MQNGVKIEISSVASDPHDSPSPGPNEENILSSSQKKAPNNDHGVETGHMAT